MERETMKPHEIDGAFGVTHHEAHVEPEYYEDEDALVLFGRAEEDAPRRFGVRVGQTADTAGLWLEYHGVPLPACRIEIRVQFANGGEALLTLVDPHGLERLEARRAARNAACAAMIEQNARLTAGG